MSNNIKRESPLKYFHRLSSQFANRSVGELFNGEAEFALVVQESPVISHLNLRGDANDQLFCSAVAEVLGLMVPRQPGTYHCNSEHSIYWLGPDEWLLVSQLAADELETRLRKNLSGHISIVDLSGGQTLINLRGKPKALRTVMKKSSVYDFEAWPLAEADCGRCARTTFAKAGALISNRADGSYDLVIRRSFADYIGQWLLDAGQEFGCRIEGDSVN